MMPDPVLPLGLVEAMRAQLPEVAGRTVAAVTAEVPEYSDAFGGEMAATIEGAVELALAGFLRLAVRPARTPDGRLGPAADGSASTGPAREGAYALGRGEARSGRTMAALLAAYRVGARVAWRELSATAVAEGLPAPVVAQFAELVFAYIDELSASSVAGHTDELARSGRVREQYRERLGAALLAGAAPDALTAAAERADWDPPATLTAVLLPSARVRDTLPLLDARTLAVPHELAGPPCPEDTTALLVPDAGRRALLAALRGRPATVGPSRPFADAASSYRRACRAATGLPPTGGPVDTEQHLAVLVLTADREALADLRARALAPLADLRPATAERLAETLRSWLLHHGRREAVAADLHVHAQTVRYRMTQVRELYGDRLTDPTSVLELTVALGVPALPEPSAVGSVGG